MSKEDKHLSIAYVKSGITAMLDVLVG